MKGIAMLLPVCSSLFAALRPVFTRSATYRLVLGILVGMMLAAGDITLTNVYLSLTAYRPDAVRRYWSLEQVLRRRSWQVEDLIAAFLGFLLARFPNGRIIADVTHTTTQGKKQAARGFRRNPHYKKGYQNQSKFLAGNDILSLAFLADEPQENGHLERFCFALGGVLLRVANKKRGEKPTLVRTIERIVPKGMIVLYDRGGNDAHTINRLGKNHTYITRLNANAVFYHDQACKHKLDIKHEPSVVQKRKRENVYRSDHICYRRGVNKPVLVVAEWFYNRAKRRWRVVFYLSTNTDMKPERVIDEYMLRRHIETTHSDSKLLSGFEDCRLRSEKSIEAWCSLSLMATGILEFLRWKLTRSLDVNHSTQSVLTTLRMHWYHPKNLTRGLVCSYLRLCLLQGQHQTATSGADLFTKNVSKPLVT
jgi:hypothetical protein